ncbi:MAG: hypothetical protein AB8G22_06765, partial [Saprospiraceae bacterium]
MRLKILLLTTVLSCQCLIGATQIHWNQSYPLLSNQSTTPLFYQEAANQLFVTGCLEDEWTQLQIQPASGALSRTSALATNTCESIQLADGQTLSFESVANGYRFMQYRGSSLVWTKVLTNYTGELTAQQVVAHPSNGFFICEPYPSKLTRFNQQGNEVYNKAGFTPVGYSAQIGQVLGNGEVILHLGHQAARNRRITIMRCAANNGQTIWETEIETAERINRDTRLSAHLDYPTIAITHHFVDNEGWEASFIDLRTGRFINNEIVYSYAERSIFPSAIPNKGIFLTESYSIENQSVNNYISIHRYNESGILFWRKPLLDSQLEQARVVSQVAALANNDLVLAGVRNDSLWLLRFDPTGDLSEATNGDIDAPDLVLKISADRPDL